MQVKIDKMRCKLKEDKDLFFALSSIEEKIKFLLRYAVLAPSTHNIQPWLYRVRNNTCELLFNPELKLKYADQKGRDLYISLGCTLENLILAARYYGLKENIAYEANDNDDNRVATILFEEMNEGPDERYQNLLETMLARVNTRGPFIDKKVSPELISKLEDLSDTDYSSLGIQINFIEDKEKIKKMAELTAKGMKLAHGNKAFRREMSHWIVNNYTRRKEGMIGYSMNMPGPISFFISSVIKYFNMGSIMGKLNLMSVSSAPLLCLVTAPKNEAETWIKIGRLAERTILELNDKGLSTSIYLASIEMGDLYQEVRKIVNSADDPQFAFVAGYMTGTFRTTPRHEPTAKLLN